MALSLGSRVLRVQRASHGPAWAGPASVAFWATRIRVLPPAPPPKVLCPAQGWAGPGWAEGATWVLPQGPEPGCYLGRPEEEEAGRKPLPASLLALLPCDSALPRPLPETTKGCGHGHCRVPGALPRWGTLGSRARSRAGAHWGPGRAPALGTAGSRARSRCLHSWRLTDQSQGSPGRGAGTAWARRGCVPHQAWAAFLAWLPGALPGSPGSQAPPPCNLPARAAPEKRGRPRRAPSAWVCLPVRRAERLGRPPVVPPAPWTTETLRAARLAPGCSAPPRGESLQRLRPINPAAVAAAAEPSLLGNTGTGTGRPRPC
ncbi:uncharacterized protein [Oryctolagus cuniculus]|uniref:uncharacterized protein n=1 Tax=Oryctolagus cuniculus TaxID=9986 RepID=UPI003879CE21